MFSIFFFNTYCSLFIFCFFFYFFPHLFCLWRTWPIIFFACLFFQVGWTQKVYKSLFFTHYKSLIKLAKCHEQSQSAQFLLTHVYIICKKIFLGWATQCRGVNKLHLYKKKYIQNEIISRMQILIPILIVPKYCHQTLI